jgi:hypothetical protein
VLLTAAAVETPLGPSKEANSCAIRDEEMIFTPMSRWGHPGEFGPVVR